MNIFVTSETPAVAACDLCDQHVVKMTLETAQMLCAAYEPGTAPYRRTHYNHPCTIWARTTKANYLWLVEYGLAIAAEYNFRYGKVHASKKVIEWCRDNVDKIDFIKKIYNRIITERPQCMPEKYKNPKSVICAYRNFYIGEKAKFATWEKGTRSPYWWPTEHCNIQKGEIYKFISPDSINSPTGKIKYNDLVMSLGPDKETYFCVKFLIKDKIVTIDRKFFTSRYFKKIK